MTERLPEDIQIISLNQVKAHLQERDALDFDESLDTPPIGELSDEELSLDERAELLGDKMLAAEVMRERQEEQLKLHGKTDRELEADADAWLRAAGFDDLAEGK